jgi:hypothetical protein
VPDEQGGTDEREEMTYSIKGARVESVSIERVPDHDPDLSYLGDADNYAGINADEAAKYLAQDRERLDAYNRGEWWCEGVRAVAKIIIPTSIEGGWIATDEIRSPGIWGVESDSDESHFAELAKEEMHQLHEILRDGYRFPDEELREHFDDA